MSDKVGKEYWNSCWTKEKNIEFINPHQLGLKNHVNRCYHEYFSQVFYGMETSKMKLLEVGCARSAWLPYFAQEFGFNVFGLDYSEIGCQQATKILSSANIKGNVVCADFFSPPEAMIEAFDVVVSFGVAEHFEDTAECVKAFSKFLKVNGVIITMIPNMVGVIGLIQRIVNRPIFDIHVPLDSQALAESHRLAELKILDCNYFMSSNFGVCNLNGIPANSPEWWFKKLALALLVRLSMIGWFCEDKGYRLKENALTSPYINCLARKL